MDSGGALKGTYLAEKLWDWAWRRASSRIFSWAGRCLGVGMEVEEDEALIKLGLNLGLGLGLGLGFWKRDEVAGLKKREEDAIDV